MKKIVICAAIALALTSCYKGAQTVNAEYYAKTYLSFRSRIVTDSGLPLADDFFEEQVRLLDNVTFFSQRISASDRESQEYAYQQADMQAVEYMNDNLDKALEKYNTLMETLEKKDVGAGDYQYEFSYYYGRDGRGIDSFKKDVSYYGGIRLKSEKQTFPLAGDHCSANIPVKFTLEDPGAPIIFRGTAKMCLPDGTYTDEKNFGNMLTVNDIAFSEEDQCYYVNITLKADAAYMSKIKSNEGNWHALIYVFMQTEDGTNPNFIIYVPISVESTGA